MQRLMSLWTILFIGCSAQQDATLSSKDIKAIKKAAAAYEQGWLANDPPQLMASMTDKAVMIPSGRTPLLGHKASRDFLEKVLRVQLEDE